MTGCVEPLRRGGFEKGAEASKRALPIIPIENNQPMDDIPQFVSLIGYRATGKTSVARLLSAATGWPWTDVDEQIEARAGKSIARIFAEDGEPAFRDQESAVVADWCGRRPLVLSTGGGTPLRPENRRALRSAGKVVWLTARPETIWARMSADATTAARRPSLTDKNPWDEIVALLAVREPIYRETADLVIDTETATVEQIAAEIVRRLSLPVEKGSGP